jgi:hypothetical protein
MAYRWLRVLLVLAVAAAGCASDGDGDPRGDAGVGGNAGTGGVGGQGAAGGMAGAGGSGGAMAPTCVTSPLCRACPSEATCDSNADCSTGSVCIESGCDDLDGLPIRQCVFAGGGACNDNAQCEPLGRECLDVPGEGKRCIKTTPGCDTHFDCVTGFACEDGSCVDRRVPCDLDADCPMNHVCLGTDSRFCVRIQTDCGAAFDCVDVAPSCVDIDGDDRTECAGTFDLNDPLSEACTNAQCGAAAPVCEASGIGSLTACGQYGLCREDSDCAESFSCLALWPDGRKECVPSGGTCDDYTDCPVRQVCASPREGGPPSCQVGYQP